MFAGIDFPSRFEKDNFVSRRTTGHNMLDPESLISGAEIQQGLAYDNSKRNWESEEHYMSAVLGNISTDEILRTAPRTSVAFETELRAFIVPNRLEAFYQLEEGE
jgi:hypothetical protein